MAVRRSNSFGHYHSDTAAVANKKEVEIDGAPVIGYLQSSYICHGK